MTELFNKSSPSDLFPVTSSGALEPQMSGELRGFEQMGLSRGILEGVKAAGFLTPSPIQSAAIPLVLTGIDLIGQAQTGTGKTAAYGLPAMSRLKNNNSVEILVLTPTRELAIQVSDELFRLGKFANVKTVPVVGGQGYLRQVELINRGAQVVVATPGRLMDHLREGRLKRFTPHIIVLDEADEMLDRGFVDDIRQILSDMPSDRQTLLFSATMPPEIKALTREFMRQPKHVQLNSGQQTNMDIEQRLIVIRGHERESALVRILEVEDPEKAIIFCRTKRDVDNLQSELTTRGVSAKSIHGDMSQAIRNQAVQALKDGRAKIIIATDVAARGLDIPNVTHVINFHVPENRERYVHRIGRTGRAGKRGVAITVATPSEIRGNDVFAKAHNAEFSVGEVPSKNDVRDSLEKQLSAKIEGLRLRNDMANFAATLAGKYSAEELAQRLVSVISAGRQVTGDDRIGVTADEARRLLSGGGPRGRSEASDDRGRFGGGGGGRKGGFRVNRGSRGFNDQPKRWGSERGSKPSGKWPNKNTSQSRERAHFSS
jgi:ATP-dependent RNA helicase DeaD